MEKKYLRLKLTLTMLTFRLNFCLGSISNGFSGTESREVSLNGNVYDFSVDWNSIDKSDILNIHKYLITKNNIKFSLVKQVFVLSLNFSSSLARITKVSDRT